MASLLFARASRSPLVQSCLVRPIVANPLFILTRAFASKKHKAMIRAAKGYRGRAKNCYRLAVRRVEKSWEHAFRDRRLKKRTWRRLWIQRLTAASRQYGLRYSRFIAHLRYCNIWLNRKVLSELAATEPFAFKACMDVIGQQDEMYHANKKEKEKHDDDEEEAAPEPMAA